MLTPRYLHHVKHYVVSMVLMVVSAWAIAVEAQKIERTQSIVPNPIGSQLAKPKLPIEYTVSAQHGEVIQNLSFKSATTGITYPYHVYLPESYANNPTKHYPVVYASDAQWVFNGFVSEAEAIKADIIIIGIEEGPRHSKRRRIDMTFPGVTHYLRFLNEEFLPKMEAQYRIETHLRALQGASLGGNLALIAMLSDNNEKRPTFRYLLAYDAAIQYQNNEINALLDQRHTHSELLPVVLILAAAQQGNARNNEVFASELSKKAFKQFNVHWHKYDVSHYGISKVAFADSLQHILSTSSPNDVVE